MPIFSTKNLHKFFYTTYNFKTGKMINMKEPKEVIEQIRKIRFGFGLDDKELPKELINMIEDKKSILENASKLTKEIHSKKLHFIFELIQNADDNEYEEHTPTIRFIIDTDRLIIQNNEKGFKEKNVWSLCNIGDSTKTKAMGYIGEKGIGFKSVFMVADRVQIYSNGFQFGFNYDENKPLTMITPEWINEIPDFVDPTQTNIVLYLKPEIRNKINKYIKEIHPSLLLFLKKLRVIEIEERDKNKITKMERYEKDGIVEVVYNERSYWKVVKKLFEVPQDIDEERRKDISETEIILSFPLKGDYSPDISNEQFVFAYLPIREYGFKFIIQADFILLVTREDIMNDNKWNEWLRNSISEVFIEAVREFKNDKNLKYGFFNYLPLEGEIKDDFFISLVEQIYEKLREEPCILTKSNNWKRPSEVLIGDSKIQEIVTNENLQNFFGKEYISHEIKAKKQVLQKLGIKDFSINDLIKCLENKEWIKIQNDKWFARLFNYLSKKKLSDEELERLKDLDIIRLENRELTSINKGPVFFPLEKRTIYGFEDELRIIKKDIIDIVSEQNKEEKDNILEFFKKLGLKQAHPYEIIENHILPVFESEDCKQKDSNTLIGYVKYIKDNIDKYQKESNRKLNARKPFGKTKADPLKHLKESLLIRINKDNEEKEWYEHPKNVYLPKGYGNENDLEILFEDMDVNFVHFCYLEQDIEPIKNEILKLKNKLHGKNKKGKKKHRKKFKKIEKKIEELEKKKSKKVGEWKEFFLKIGVWKTIIVKKDPNTKIYEGPDYANYEVTKMKIYKGDKEKTIWRNEEWKDTDWTYYIEDDYISLHLEQLLDKFKKDLSNNKVKISKRLLKIFDEYWDIYNNMIKTMYYYRYRGQQGWKQCFTKSTFYLTLLNNAWLPTTQNTLVKPPELFLDKPEIREVLGNTVPYLAIEIKSKDLIEALGINTQADVQGVLNYLKALIERKSEDTKKFKKLYKFLNEHFEEDPIKIKDAFKNHPLIFVPDTNNKYYRTDEVLWEDVSEIFGNNRAYLEKYYPEELKEFFLKKLEIREKPIPKDYADVLCSISQKSNISDEDKEIIKRIYEELNRNLNPKKNEDPISEEDWWKNFIKKPIFFLNRGKFGFNNGNIFINDDKELYELFKDEEDIDFLWLPDNYHSDKIKFFIKSCGICYLSESIEIKPLLESIKHFKKDKNLTQHIQKIVPYILRYLFCKENEEYEKLKNSEMLDKIGTIEVYVTEYLKVKYSIKVNEQKKIKKEGERKCIYHKDNNCIYMKRNGSIYNIAVEFSKVFGEIKGLEDFVMNIMINVSDAEDIMRAKNIDPLPPSEEKKISKILRKVSKISDTVVEKAEKEKQLPKNELKRSYSEEEKVETEKNISIPEETLTQHLSELTLKTHSSNDKDRLVSTEEEWTPKFSPEEVPTNIKQYVPKEKIKKIEEEIKSLDRKHATRSQASYGNLIQSAELLNEKIQKAIGRWGEEYVFRCIKNEMTKKFPDASLSDTEQGFKVEKEGNIIVEVIWENKNGESGQHYDIKIIENLDEIIIEVKSTKENEKSWFQVSKNQWRLMNEKGDQFYIYRVYGAGTKNAKLEKIPNPAKLWKEGSIDAHPVGIEI